MDADEALRFVEQLLAQKGKRLNDLQRIMFRGSWEGKSSRKIYQECSSRCTYQHLIQNVGPELWRQLSEVVGDRISKRNLQGPIEQVSALRSRLVQDSIATQAEPSPSEPQAPYEPENLNGSEPENLNGLWDEANPKCDWGNIPAVSSVFGRNRELEQLEERINFNGCCLIVLFGAPGIGKTTLAAKLAEQVKEKFDYLIWRSMKRPRTLQALTAELIQFFSDEQDSSTDLTRLLHYLRNRRCLVILDGLESVLRSRVHNGAYQDGYEDYSDLLKEVGQTVHQSCFVLTSAENPKEVTRMDGENQRVFALKLEGLGELAAREFLTAKGAFSCADSDWRLIIQRYEGNPSALNAIATNVREVFGGDVKNFLEQLQQGTALFEDIRSLLDRQFNRLSDLERAIVECLVTHHEPLSITELIQSSTHPVSTVEVQEVLQSLLRRSLIESNAAGYALQPLMTEYVAQYVMSHSFE